MRSTSLYNQIIPYWYIKVKKRLANMTSLFEQNLIKER